MLSQNDKRISKYSINKGWTSQEQLQKALKNEKVRSALEKGTSFLEVLRKTRILKEEQIQEILQQHLSVHCVSCKEISQILGPKIPASSLCEHCGEGSLELLKSEVPEDPNDTVPPEFLELFSEESPPPEEQAQEATEVSIPEATLLVPVEEEWAEASVPFPQTLTPLSPMEDEPWTPLAPSSRHSLSQKLNLSEVLEQKTSKDQMDTPQEILESQLKDAFQSDLFQTSLKPQSTQVIHLSVAGNRILGRLGQQVKSCAYLAEDVVKKEKRVLKLFPLESISTDSLALFLKRGKVLESLKHPGLVQVYKIGQEGKHYYALMAIVEGINLEDKVKQQGALEWKEATSFVKKIAETLDYLHQNAVIHGNLKPSNLILSSEGLLLTDTRLLQDDVFKSSALSFSGQIVGSPAYMSPEECKGISTDSRSDFYALGLIFYFLLTGKTAFSGTSLTDIMMKHLNEDPPSIRKTDPNLPPAIDLVLKKMVAKKIEKRYRSALDLIHDLTSLLNQNFAEILNNLAEFRKTAKLAVVQSETQRVLAQDELKKAMQLLRQEESKKESVAGRPSSKPLEELPEEESEELPEEESEELPEEESEELPEEEGEELPKEIETSSTTAVLTPSRGDRPSSKPSKVVPPPPPPPPLPPPRPSFSLDDPLPSAVSQGVSTSSSKGNSSTFEKRSPVVSLDEPLYPAVSRSSASKEASPPPPSAVGVPAKSAGASVPRVSGVPSREGKGVKILMGGTLILFILLGVSWFVFPEWLKQLNQQIAPHSLDRNIDQIQKLLTAKSFQQSKDFIRTQMVIAQSVEEENTYKIWLERTYDEEIKESAIQGQLEGTLNLCQKALQEFPEALIFQPEEILMKALKSSDLAIQKRAILLLAQARLETGTVVPELIALLGNPALQEELKKVLIECGQKDSGAVFLMMQALQKPDLSLRIALTQILGKVGSGSLKAVPALVKLLSEPDENLASASAYALAEASASSSEVLPLLFESGKKINSSHEKFYEVIFREIGKKERPLTPELLEYFKAKEELFRNWVVLALEERGVSDTEQVHFFIQNLDHTHRLVREKLRMVLVKIGMRSPQGLHKMARSLLQEPKKDIREALLDIFAKVGSLAKEGVPALLEALKDKDERIRKGVVNALAKIEDKSPEVLTALLKALLAPEESVQEEVRVALEKLGSPALFPQLLPLIKDPDYRVRRQVLSVIGSYGTEARSAIPDILSALEDPHEKVREKAAWAIGKVGAPVKQAIPALKKALQDSNEDVCYWAISAIGELGLSQKEIVVELIQTLFHSSGVLRENAKMVLHKVVQQSDEPAQIFLPCLAHKDRRIRLTAIESLGELGAKGEQALPELKKLLKDPDEKLREAAYKTIQKLQKN
jgi:serine/threonine protein kinase/HEAT repeat protein